MADLVRGTSSNCATPALDLFTTIDGEPADCTVVQFQIFDVRVPLVPVQVFPVAGRQAAIPLVDCPAGDRLGPGHYVARWTTAADLPLGSYEIRWFFVFDGPEFTFTDPFQVLAEAVGASGFRGYCTVEDLRAEGVTEAMASYARLRSLIEIATMEIDDATGWWFDAQTRTVIVNGSGGRALRLPAPAIQLDGVTIGGTVFDIDPVVIVGGSPIFGGTYDDGPLLELPNGAWDRGRRNVVVTGLFGFREFDGTIHGRIPLAIRRACMLLVMGMLTPLGEDDGLGAQAGRITSMSTRTQSVSFAAPVGTDAPLTGNAQVDAILMRYRRPGFIGSV